MRPIAVTLGLAGTLAAACSGERPTHKCKVESAAEREAFGALANMTAGASYCEISGLAVFYDMMSDVDCTVGGTSCVPVMTATFTNGTSAADVRTRYRTWLGEHGWHVTEEPFQDGWALEVTGGDWKGDTYVLVMPRGGSTVVTETVRRGFVPMPGR